MRHTAAPWHHRRAARRAAAAVHLRRYHHKRHCSRCAAAAAHDRRFRAAAAARHRRHAARCAAAAVHHRRRRAAAATRHRRHAARCAAATMHRRPLRRSSHRPHQSRPKVRRARSYLFSSHSAICTLIVWLADQYGLPAVRLPFARPNRFAFCHLPKRSAHGLMSQLYAQLIVPRLPDPFPEPSADVYCLAIRPSSVCVWRGLPFVWLTLLCSEANNSSVCKNVWYKQK